MDSFSYSHHFDLPLIRAEQITYTLRIWHLTLLKVYMTPKQGTCSPESDLWGPGKKQKSFALLYSVFFSFFGHAACGILVPWPGIEPMPHSPPPTPTWKCKTLTMGWQGISTLFYCLCKNNEINFTNVLLSLKIEHRYTDMKSEHPNIWKVQKPKRNTQWKRSVLSQTPPLHPHQKCSSSILETRGQCVCV